MLIKEGVESFQPCTEIESVQWTGRILWWECMMLEATIYETSGGDSGWGKRSGTGTGHLRGKVIIVYMVDLFSRRIPF